MVGMETGQEMKEGEEGLHVGAEREKAGERPAPCSGGRVLMLGRKRKMRETKDRPESGPGGVGCRAGPLSGNKSLAGSFFPLGR